jgi:spermidine dehydrogenase
MSGNPKKKLSKEEKKRLGLDRSISRREVMKLAAVGVGSLIIPGCTPRSTDPPFNPISPTAPHAIVGGNTEEAVTSAHNFMWERLSRIAEDTDEVFDLVIVGAGLGGLTAAYYYHQERPEAKILLLDNHANFGGDAQRNEMTIKGQKIIVTQAGDYQWTISPEYKAVKKLWDELGIDLSLNSEIKMTSAADQDHMFINGQWIRDFWESGYKSASSPWSKKNQADYDAFFEAMQSFSWDPWQKVKAELAEWDKISFKQWMEDVNGWGPELTHLIDMWVRSDYGAGVDTLSAASGFWNYSGSGTVKFKWPGGLSGFARHLVNALIPNSFTENDIINADINHAALDSLENQISIRLESTVVDVHHEGPAETADHVLIKYMKGNQLFQLKAKSVIMAGGGYMAKRIVTDMPQTQKEAYEKFHYSAYMVANVWVNNSRALDNLDFGYSGSIWDPKIASFITIADGITDEGHDPNRDPERPNCITLWCPPLPNSKLNGDYEEQGKKGREELLDNSFEDYEILIRQELLDVFGAAGFDPAEDIEGIAINRWGHAEVICYPGFAFGSGSSDNPIPGVPIYDAAQRFGRIAFAHTDLNGFADNQGTTRISRRAVSDLLD